MLTFKQVGKTNTDVTLKLAIQTALEREMDLVVATTKGDTALRAAELAREMGFSGKLVAVSCAYGAKAVNENSLSDEMRGKLHQQGVTVVLRTHSAERSAESARRSAACIRWKSWLRPCGCLDRVSRSVWRLR